ncbi:MAG TPA: 4Fe-4S dicluster domain-containing protein [Bryobacteraceae bacterium]|nr:4Fe-4S dicluster domain-containing protein [Bryobacteraceae bacterium]
MAPTQKVQPDPAFIQNLMELGAGDLKKCYQCATCSVACHLGIEDANFPRKQMLAAQWGLKDRLLDDPGPWLCFYCGECSERCPRQANPGETMMALRRYLTAQYDWTGLSALMYRSAFWEVAVLAIVSLAVVLAFVLPASFGFGLLNPYAMQTVQLNHFAPKEIVHVADRIMALVLGFLLLSNAGRMFFRLTHGKGIPLSAYVTNLPGLIYQGVTQARWRNCRDRDTTKNWIRHFLLVTGYATMFTLVVVFLPTFQVEDSSFHWTSILGYYATAVMLGSTTWMISDRALKRTQMHRFSHLSDWLFPILLFLTALTGILLHLFRLMNWAMPTYILYVVHLAIVVPMLVVEVPFGKWAHLLYRPIAIYVVAVRRQAEGYFRTQGANEYV